MADTLIWVFRWIFWILTVAKENLGEESGSYSGSTFVNVLFFAFGLSSLVAPVFMYLLSTFNGIEASSIFLPAIFTYLIIGLGFYFFRGEFFSQENKRKRWQYRGSW